MDRNDAKNFLGCGWSFPVRVDEITGRIRTSSHEDDIREAIGIIIMTRKGERMMKPEFGCGIQEYMFMGMDYTTMSQMELEIKNALTLWEPRITDIDVTVEAPGGIGASLSIHISCTVRATNSPFNQVYPYFMSEGQE